MIRHSAIREDRIENCSHRCGRGTGKMLIVDVERATVLLDLAEVSIAKVLVRPNRLNGIVFAHARKQSKDKALSFAELASARTDFNAARNTEQIEVKRARHIVTDFWDRADQPDPLAGGRELGNCGLQPGR